MRHCVKPCAECPWRRDVPTGRFPPERFVALASTMYDLARTVFACHKTADDGVVDKTMACAGFILHAHHNLSLRMHRVGNLSVDDGGYPLYNGYRAMAVANGVDPSDPALGPVRDPND